MAQKEEPRLVFCDPNSPGVLAQALARAAAEAIARRQESEKKEEAKPKQRT